MKNELIRVALAMTALGTVLLSLSCGGGVGNLNPNSTPTGTEPSPPECTGTTQEKVDKINKAIDERIKKDPEAQAQRVAGTFSISTGAENDVIVIRIAGKVAGGNNIKGFLAWLNSYIRKECVRIIKFEPMNTNSNTTMPAPANTATVIPTAAASDFQWILCEPPMNACPNGECTTTTCPSGMALAPTNSNSNTNSKTNSNTNSNSNKGNTNKP